MLTWYYHKDPRMILQGRHGLLKELDILKVIEILRKEGSTDHRIFGNLWYLEFGNMDGYSVC